MRPAISSFLVASWTGIAVEPGAGVPGPRPETPVVLPDAKDVAPGLVRTRDGSSVEDEDAPTLRSPEPLAPPPKPPRPLWIRRFSPERHMVTFGLFGGVFLADERHDLYDPRTAPVEPLWAISPNVGVRLGYFPLAALGVEAEFSAIPTRMRTGTNDPVFVYGAAAHVVAQLPFARVVPFLLAGGGLLGVRSPTILLGNDVDPAIHYGGGVKLAIHRWVEARVEVRNVMSAAAAVQESAVSHVQILGGIAITRRPRPRTAPVVAPENPDRDRDGIRNAVDECPDDVGVPPHGCPDTDGDGFRDAEDPCPNVAGDGAHGCPDTDGDGFRDPDDSCPDVPETVNGYLDQDGCADEVPQRIQQFTGTIEGISFDLGQATIRPSSVRVLDEAVAVLREYPDVRVRIVGHTDDIGSEAFNLDLSQRRADAVAAYLVEGGIDAQRIETEGRGDRAPRVPNDSPEHRAQNRRIDFEILPGRSRASK